MLFSRKKKKMKNRHTLICAAVWKNFQTHAKKEKLCTQDNMWPDSTHMECSGKAIGDWKRRKQISDHINIGKKMEMSVNGHEVIWEMAEMFSMWLMGWLYSPCSTTRKLLKKYVERSELVACHYHPESPILRTHLGVGDVAWWTAGSASMHEVLGPNPSIVQL